MKPIIIILLVFFAVLQYHLWLASGGVFAVMRLKHRIALQEANNTQLQKQVNEKLLFFEKYPTHPSFHLEKLIKTKIWSIRLNKGNRLFFVWNKTKDTAIFFFIGPHDAYRTIGKK